MKVLGILAGAAEGGLRMAKKVIFLSGLFLAAILLLTAVNLRQQERLFPIKESGRWGLMDRRGKIIIKPHFENITYWSEGLTGVQIDKKWGFIDRSGKLVIPARFDNVGMFSEGMVAVMVGEEWGYIDRSGKIRVQPRYYTALDFHEGLAAVKDNENSGNWVYVDKQGRVINPEIPQTAYFPYKFSGMPTNQFSCGLAPIFVEDELKWTFIDKKGRLKNWRFQGAWDFSEGLAPVVKEINGESKMGYIDTRGNLAIDYKFDAGMPFTEGLAAVMIGGKFCYIDKKGRVVLRPDADTGYFFSEGLAKVCTADKCGFIDRKGKMVIRPEFTSGLGPYNYFQGGLAEASKIEGDSWVYGYIDKTGKYIYKQSEE
ncbi:MAG: WG repeat-containing protein [Candidatus Omnitrophica bacterium]|nr:WG repeat-containing protein [Candidatus Omnitrophota bacterium]